MSAVWIHTPAQLLANLREACHRYRLKAYGQALEIRRLRSRIAELQDGIGQAMTSLACNPDLDVVWYDKITTLWDFLNEVRDPDDTLPAPPKSFGPDDTVEAAYAALPRDPATGRPVIA